MSYFIFKGVDSRTLGVTSKSAIPPIAERAFKTTEIPGRAEPLNRLDVMRKNITLPITLSIVDMSKLSEINAWLQGKGDLILSDDLSKKYRAYINQAISPARLLKLYGSIPIIFTVEPFRYSVTNPFVSTPMGMDDDTLTGSMTIINNGTAESEPKWYFSFAGKLRVTVNGSENPLIITTPGEYTGEYEADVSGGTAKYYYDYKQQNIYVDVSSRLAYMFSGSKKLVVVNQTAGIFPELKPGENSIVVELVQEEWEHDGRIYKSHNQKLQYLGYNKNERWY